MCHQPRWNESCGIRLDSVYMLRQHKIYEQNVRNVCARQYNRLHAHTYSLKKRQSLSASDFAWLCIVIRPSKYCSMADQYIYNEGWWRPSAHHAASLRFQSRSLCVCDLNGFVIQMSIRHYFQLLRHHWIIKLGFPRWTLSGTTGGRDWDGEQHEKNYCF